MASVDEEETRNSSSSPTVIVDFAPSEKGRKVNIFFHVFIYTYIHIYLSIFAIFLLLCRTVLRRVLIKT